MNPAVLYEDPHILVCIKPAGIPVQSRQLSVPDMVSILKNHLKSGVPGGKEPYLAIIHRLDQPVTGILVFAKTAKAAKSLNIQMQGSGFGKYYRALLLGIPDILEADLENFMVKNGRTNVSRICAKDTPGAKIARLHYRVSEIREPFSVAEIKLDTGRHHQIRVQMAHIGCPIAGDKKYGGIPEGDVLSPEGLQLFAYRLEFLHPVTREPMVFEMPCLDKLP